MKLNIRFLRNLFAISLLGIVPLNANAQLGQMSEIRAQRLQAARGFVQSYMRSAAEILNDNKNLYNSLNNLGAQNPNKVDVYALIVAMDSDAVFGREAKESAQIISNRYSANNKTILLGMGDEIGANIPDGNLDNIAASLAKISQTMDQNQDVLVMYITSHGNPNIGLAFKDGDRAFGYLGPTKLAGLLNDLGIKNRAIIISSCFSGVFLAPLVSNNSIIITAASSDRSSFGCRPDNDWTFFGDAMINTALRTNAKLPAAFENAQTLIKQWEDANNVTPSNPQISVGNNTNSWLNNIEANIPTNLGQPSGRRSYATSLMPPPKAKAGN